MTTRELEEKVIENEIRDLESLVDEIESEKRNVLGLNFEIDAEQPEKEDEEKESPEFKPFDRRLGEFAMWRSLYKHTLFTMFCTLFDFFNFEIYAPLLIFYFFFVCYVMCKVKIEHMIRYRYVPWSSGGKTSYGK